jgi:peptidyl-prolyl cis-trans isomerase C
MRIRSTLAWTAGEALHAVRSTRRAKLVLATVLAVAVAGAGTLAWGWSQRLPDGAALAVGDEVVTVAQLEERVQTLRALYGVEPPVDDPERMATFRRDAAKAVAVGMVLADRAADMEVGIAETRVRETLGQYVTSQFGEGPAAYGEFVQVLGNVGTSEAAVLDEIGQQLAVAELFDRVTRDVTTSDADVQAAFPDYQERLSTPETRTVANIVVASEADAQGVVAQLAGGAPFADVARAVSIDGSTRDRGGDLGTVARSQLLPGYGDAAFAAPAGGIFGPVQNEFGWNVGQVVAVTPGQVAQFEAVAPQVRQLVDFDRRLAVWSEWLAGSIRDADVRYADEYLPADPDAAPTGALGGAPVAPR